MSTAPLKNVETEQEPEELAEASYEGVLAAVSSTRRGRWFLEEFTRRNRQADTQEVLSALAALKESIAHHREEGRIEVLRAELHEMASAITHTRSEIAAIKSDEAASDHITAATGELEAIVTATEKATGDILEAAETIQEISEQLHQQDGTAKFGIQLEELVTGIFMACSFQDITGQRTTKVVNALRYIEQRVNTMIEIWGVKSSEAAETKSVRVGVDPQDKRPDADLLSGPAAAGEGISQDDIDAMLGGDFSAFSEDEVGTAEALVDSVESRIKEGDQENGSGTSTKQRREDTQPEAPEGSGAFDQSDIDSLFD